MLELSLKDQVSIRLIQLQNLQLNLNKSSRGVGAYRL